MNATVSPTPLRDQQDANTHALWESLGRNGRETARQLQIPQSSLRGRLARHEAKLAAAPADPAPVAAPAAPVLQDAPSTSATPGRTPRTFDPAGTSEHKCAGTCGQVKPVQSFPTTAGGKLRGVECRACRDTRKAHASA